MTHEHSFPDSTEAPDARTARAIEALNYEERAGLGFRRRIRGAMGNPFAPGESERYQIDREQTAGELWAGYLAGLGLVLGAVAMVYKPLLIGFLAITLCVLGSLADGPASRIAKWGLWMSAVGFSAGMSLSIFVTHNPIW